MLAKKRNKKVGPIPKAKRTALPSIGVLAGLAGVLFSSSYLLLGWFESRVVEVWIDQSAGILEEDDNGDGRFLDAMGMWGGELVDHVPYGEMSHQRFFTQYQAKRKPVVITGIYDDSPLTEGVDEENWGWEALRRRFGDIKLENRVPRGISSKGCTGTGLCEGELVKLSKLLDNNFVGVWAKRRAHSLNTPYVHDIDLAKSLPEMFDVYRKPSLFAENLLLPTKGGKDRWPSLFLGANGTQTNLHVDSMGTSFTMAVFRGRKQFVMFDAEDGPKLCMEHPSGKLDYGVGDDPFMPDFRRCREAREAKAMFANVTSGDLLFIPGHVHHAARNLVQSVGISQNFLTVNDFHAVMEDFAGYVAKLERKRKLPVGKGNQSPVTIDFLSVRDLFKLLAETNFKSSWILDEPFLRADIATNESYRRIVSHLTMVVNRDPQKYSTRLAYFCNMDLVIIALKAAGVWDCVADRDKQSLEEYEQNKPDDSTEEALNALEPILMRPSDTSTCSIAKESWLDTVLNKKIQEAVVTIEHERGVSQHCC